MIFKPSPRLSEHYVLDLSYYFDFYPCSHSMYIKLAIEKHGEINNLSYDELCRAGVKRSVSGLKQVVSDIDYSNDRANIA